MPMVAYFEERPPAADRRRSVRRALRLGAATGDAGQLATIHDLSLTGALLETSVPMLVGATFEVELPQAGTVEASVMWNSGEFYGCQFALPISPAVLSAALGPELFRSFIAVRRAEWEAMKDLVHDDEVQLLLERY